MTTGDTPAENEAASEPTDGEHDRRLAFLVKVALRGSQELRAQLPIDEASFLHTEPVAENARDFYLYGVADEVARAGVAMLRWEDLVSDEDRSEGGSAALDRAVISSLLSEQSMWCRRLLECLVDLICFEATTALSYFHHLLLVRRLARLQAYQNNLKDFYGETNANIAHTTDVVVSEVLDLEQGIDLDTLWYLRDPKAKRDKWSGTVGSSFRQRLIQALELASPQERILIGLTYGPFARLSEQIHFTPDEAHAQASQVQLEQGFSSVGILCAATLVRAYALEGLEPQTEFSRQLWRSLGQATAADALYKLHSDPTAGVGDFVLVHNTLAVIVERKKSKFGLVTLRVEYLVERPIEGISHEWIPSHHVRLIFSRSNLARGVRKVLEDNGYPTEHLNDAPSAEALRESVVAAWKAGLREAMLSGTT